MTTTLLAVNGTLMRGLELNKNMTNAGGVGKVKLQDGSEVLGVLAEPWLVEGQKEITELGSWRQYTGHHHIA